MPEESMQTPPSHDLKQDLLAVGESANHQLIVLLKLLLTFILQAQWHIRKDLLYICFGDL